MSSKRNTSTHQKRPHTQRISRQVSGPRESHAEKTTEDSIDSSGDSASDPSPPVIMNMQLNVVWLVLVALSFGTRMWQLTTPKYVVFDEVHFGRFTSFHILRIFFFDVHPPFGKFLLYLAGYFSGFDGNFLFNDIGQELGDYEDHVWHLRFVSALFGSLVPLCVYEVIVDLGCSHWNAALGSFLAVFENMMIVQSRLVLIDAPLLFFTVFSAVSYLKFRKQRMNPFSVKWWFWLGVTGFSITGATSTKYAGFLTVLQIGFLTCVDLWKMIGDRKVEPSDLGKHFISRLFLLVKVPILLYLVQFFVLFQVLIKSGPHDDMMSSVFQASLKGGLAKVTKGQAIEVSYGSQVTLRHTYGQQCWLHSHEATYPVKYPDGRGSSAQQQVTCYSFKDVNNWWIIKHPESDSLQTDDPPHPVHNGDIIQIVHGTTGRALNSHDVAAPLAPQHQEVSCYIDYNISMPAQNLWRVEISNPDASGIWKTIQSQVRLIHTNTSQAIKITGAQLPDWAFNQLEVCTDRAIYSEDTVWNVEEHQQNITKKKDDNKEDSPEVPDDELAVPMPFLPKFWEMQTKMLQANKELEQEHTFSSRPFQWPIMGRGVAYWIHKTSNAQIYCIGNAVVWWSGLLSVLGYSGLLVIYLLRRRRRVYDIEESVWEQYVFGGKFLVVGWLIHYIPYFTMSRTLFVHHYLPALLFQIILLPFLVHHVDTNFCRQSSLRWLLHIACGLLAVSTLLTFQYFSPFTYGHFPLSSAEINQRRWFRTWDMLAHPNT